MRALALLLAVACATGTGQPTTPISPNAIEDPVGWTEEAFQDLVAHCQVAEAFTNCASSISGLRDMRCSVEAVYSLIDQFDSVVDRDARVEMFDDVMVSQLHPDGDCVGWVLPSN